MFPIQTKIMIIDDSANMRTRLRTQLKELGFDHVVEAENGQEALEQLQMSESNGNLIQLIIVDWEMPVMNGIEFVRALKVDPKYQQIPILMATAVSELEQAVQAIKAGVSSFITKPFERDQLQYQLENVWRNGTDIASRAALST